MKIWVVGGAGYIGSHVCKALLAAGHEPVVFDNLSTGRRENLLPGVPLFVGDILDPAALKSAIGAATAEQRFDGVVHLAALKAANESMLEPEKYSRHNITGSLNLLEAVAAAGIPAFVFSSTAAVYGAPEYQPLDENHPTRPENYYGHTKLAIEGFLDWYGRLRGFRHVSLRYFNAAGYDPDGRIIGLEQNPANLLPVVMETAAGIRKSMQVFGDDYDTVDGSGVRDYIHVTDLADAHVRALEHLHKGGENLTLNLGTGTGISVLQMIRRAAEITGHDIPHAIVGRRAGDAGAVVASAELAGKRLGWRARHSDLDTLLKTTWNAYVKNAVEG
ncbi:MAG TPA: UDP-glucose 4-epimerase GalE [Fibrobacteria bacterium]|nr:UDP-glucose 4-epimerase GalE [Fibrobacteria bacterium]